MVLLARNDPKALAGNSSENQSCLRPTALGGGRKTDGETVWETGRIPGERDKGGKKRTRSQTGVRTQRWQCHRPA